MPNVVVEYTDNLTAEGRIPTLLRMIATRLADSGGVFPIGGVRVRAHRLTEYVVADGADDYAFVVVTATIGPGRSAEFKRAFFGDLFEAIKIHFNGAFKRRYLSLALYVEEADEAGSFKANNIHDKFRSVS